MLDIAARCCHPLSIFVTAVVEVAMFNPVLSFFPLHWIKIYKINNMLYFVRHEIINWDHKMLLR